MNGKSMGICIALGAGIGAALFAATQNPMWIALGAGVGVAFGAVMGNRGGGKGEE